MVGAATLAVTLWPCARGSVATVTLCRVCPPEACSLQAAASGELALFAFDAAAAAPRDSLVAALGMMAQVAGELGGEEACNDALARDALGQMLCARRAEVEERLRACAAASAGQQGGGPEAGGGGDEEQAAGWAGVQSSIQLLLEAERVAIDSSLDAMGAREEAEEAL